MNDLFDLAHNPTVILFFSIWLLFVGLIVLGSYFLKERIAFFRYVADFLIAFSFVKRTKNILLSYAALLFLIGLAGCLFALMQ